MHEHVTEYAGGEFAHQVVLVTGAARGIGAAVARMFAREGAAVGLLDIDGRAVEQLVQQLRADGHRALALDADLCDGNAVERAVTRCERELGAIDVLASVAGVLHSGTIQDTTDAEWEHTFAVNTTAVFRLCRTIGRSMRARQHGNIVAVCSNAARVPRLGMAAYAASKAATAHFIRNLALELAPHGVRCNVVSPGSTDTEMQRLLWNSPDDARRVIQGQPESFRVGIPLGRIADPDDIASAVVFLASSRARHITMHDLCVDGGAILGA